MQAKNLALFIICFQLASAVISGSGVFVVDPEPYDTGLATIGSTADLGAGVTDISGNVSGENDIATGISGAGMILSSFGAMYDMLGALILPYGFLTDIGVPSTFAVAIQVICNLTLGWAVIQFVSGRSTASME